MFAHKFYFKAFNPAKNHRHRMNRQLPMRMYNELMIRYKVKPKTRKKKNKIRTDKEGKQYIIETIPHPTLFDKVSKIRKYI